MKINDPKIQMAIKGMRERELERLETLAMAARHGLPMMAKDFDRLKELKAEDLSNG